MPDGHYASFFAGKTIKSILLLVFLVLGIQSLEAQSKKKNDYIARDTIMVQGEVFTHNSKKITYIKGIGILGIDYTPIQVTEYRDDNVVYESLSINGDTLFYKRIVSGEVNLYRDKRIHVLKKDGKFTAFTKKDFRSAISTVITCEGKDPSLSTLDYSKKAIRNFVKTYNAGTCSSDNLPFRRLGFFVGYTSLHVEGAVETIVGLEGKANTFALALFADLPLYTPRSLFLTPELHLLYGKPQLTAQGPSRKDVFGVHLAGVVVPLSIKWRKPSGNVKPYVKSGPLMSFVSIESPTGLVSNYMDRGAMQTAYSSFDKASSFVFGFNLGGGMEVTLAGKKSFHTEVKYMKSFDGSFDSATLSFSTLSIIAGLSF